MPTLDISVAVADKDARAVEEWQEYTRKVQDIFEVEDGLLKVNVEEIERRLQFLGCSYCNPEDALLARVGGADLREVNANRAGGGCVLPQQTQDLDLDLDEDEENKGPSFREFAGWVVSSTLVQALVLLVVAADLCITIFVLTSDEAEADVFKHLSIAVVVLLGTENLTRLYWQRRRFFLNWINVLEGATVILSVVMLVTDGSAAVGALRVVRPLAKGYRGLRMLWGLYKTEVRDAKSRPRGSTTRSSTKPLPGMEIPTYRRRALHLVDHVVVQCITWCAILVDVTIAVMAIVESGEHEGELGQSLNVISYAVVGWLALEIAVRIVGKGAKYFSEPLCVLELVVVITALFVDGIAILRATRPVLRALRVLRVLLSIYNKRSNAANSLRHAVRMNKRGFVDGQYDLDLCYLNQQVVAMSVPAVGQESMYRNPLERVAQFFNERHPNLYLILNLCSEKDYPVQPFFGRCLRFPFDDHSVPTLAMMLEFGAVVQAFFATESEARGCHSLQGRQRTDRYHVLCFLAEQWDLHHSVRSLGPF
mmetsp:Transcript_83616/g.223630  ORF Transcript_83616/g.223630 Transcript_83616/m.223630 type:complete len:537 (+) Transcript_83616:29-1639(+)